MEKEDPEEGIQELSAIFSNANFPSGDNNNDNPTEDENQLELNIGTTMPQLCSTEYLLKTHLANVSRNSSVMFCR